MNSKVSKRLAGITVPLFSVRSRADWGIGEIADLPMCAEWIRASGHTLLQVLPPHDLGAGESSPYGARTAFGLDLIYLALRNVEDFQQPLDLTDSHRSEIEALRALPHVDYRRVRAIKEYAIETAFARFLENEWRTGSVRASALRAFVESEREWLVDFAAYSAGQVVHSWEEAARVRNGAWLSASALGAAERAALKEAYTQWQLFSQWDAAKRSFEALRMELMGDLPFIVGKGSADVWAHPSEFDTSVSLGAPPDDFSADGQDWGLPAYAWEVMDANQLAWLRARAAHAARLYHRYRVDHVVGFFRMWTRRNGAPGTFNPATEPEQHERGDKVLRAFVEASGEGAVIAEDLGVIPDFVRHTMRERGIPGYKVIPWERDAPHLFRDPRAFDALSVATWSTHDTAPITSWWDSFAHWEKEPLARLAEISPDAFEPARTFALLRLLYRAGSALTLTLVQELIGDTARINTPGTVNESNWTYRLPRPIEDLELDEELSLRFSKIREMVREGGR